MFAYIIIGIELVILYFIFWVVFIREPKPREIRAELWGLYSDWDKSIAEKTQVALPSVSLMESQKRNHYLPSTLKVRAYKMAKSLKRRRRIRRKHLPSTHLYRAKKDMINTSRQDLRKNGFMIQEPSNRKIVERFLLLLNQTLNTFSVKMP